jgi:hypothetical protein
MSMNQPSAAAPALAGDIRQILGELDERRMLDILALKPTVPDLEEVRMYLSGDKDIFSPGEPLKQLAGAIVSIISADDEEENGRRSP